MDQEPSESRVIATRNRNSNFVLVMLHRLPRGRFGHLLVDGLKQFGIPMLFGIEPRVYLIAKAAPDLTFAGREANENSPVTRDMPPDEQRRRFLQYLRSLGYNVN